MLARSRPMIDTGGASKVVLQFLPDWQQSQNGTILRGGTVAVKFAPERLSACRQSMRGAEVWDIEAVAKFHPRPDVERIETKLYASRPSSRRSMRWFNSPKRVFICSIAALGPRRRPPVPDHVFGDRRFGDLEPELQ